MASDAEGTSQGPEVIILFVGLSLCLGILSRQILHNTRVPYTVALLVLGIGIGALEYGTSHGLGSLGQSIRLWSKINPNLIIYVFLPALLFESSFGMDVHQIKRCIAQMVLLAGPGVVISTFCLGAFHHYIFPYDWNWKASLLLGGLLSATDPVAVVALLKELGASKKLSTIIEGESLMNDGTAMVVFELFLEMALGKHFSAGEIVGFLSKVAFAAVALGLAFGIVAVLWLGVMFNDTVMEITLTLTASYLAFFTAQSEFEVSGVLTVITVGIFFAAFARTAFRGESQQSMHHFWNMIAYIANTLIFILSGVVIAEQILTSHEMIQGRDWGYLFLLYVFLQLSRGVVVIVLYPGLKFYGYGLSWKEAVVLVWAGLRGAVALSLALSVHKLPANVTISSKTQALFVFFTGGIVFLTLIINGSTTQFLLHFLRIEKTCETKMLVLEHVKYEMNRKAVEAFEELGQDEELGPADWMTVRKYISCLNRFTEDVRPVHPHLAEANEDAKRLMQLQDTRIRFLNGIQASYWEMLEEGRVTQTAAIILMQSVDEALDEVAKHRELNDWTGLRPHVHFPGYLRRLQSGSAYVFPQKLLTFLVVERLELGCYISAAFLRAHILARHQLRDFIGETDVSEAIIRESEEEENEAKQYLEDVRLAFPQVLRVLKTRQVIHAVLVRLSEYVQSLEKAGLLEERETIQLHDAVQIDLKKLHRNPPVVQMPKGSEILNVQPFIGALPINVQVTLSNSAKEYMKLRGTSLYKEGSKADGIWLIANGVVKWKSQFSGSGHLVQPTFSHGSTLGLYEVLMGKPYLCDLTADSVVHCYFIDASKIVGALQSDPQVEDFYWQESALAVAKIILPQLFEAVPMQEMRAMVMDDSVNYSFIRGEIIELHAGEVAILLEGFLKQEGKEGIITAPSALIFSTADSFTTLPDTRHTNAIYNGSLFHAETRSRIIILHLAPEQLRRQTGSLRSHSLLRKHTGSFLVPRQWKRRNSEQGLISKGSEYARGSSNMMAKATELGLFGSMVHILSSSDHRRSTGQLPHAPRPNQTMAIAKKTSEKQIITSFIYPRKDEELRIRPFYSHGNLTSLPVASLPPIRTRRVKDVDSSDGSDGDDDHIMEIESPSNLFRNH